MNTAKPQVQSYRMLWGQLSAQHRNHFRGFRKEINGQLENHILYQLSGQLNGHLENRLENLLETQLKQ